MLYQHWLYGSLTPELDFERNSRFKISPQVTITFEILFGWTGDS
jgi:hypothetical protein